MSQIENPAPFGHEHVEHSRFNMFRCIIAIAHADNVVTPEEREYIEGFFEVVPFSAEQLATLKDDLKRKHDPGQFLKEINNPEYRSQVVYFARLMAYKDGHMDPREEHIIEKLHSTIMDGIDVEQIEADVKAHIAELDALHEADKKAFEEEHSFSNYMGRFAKSFGTKPSE